MIRSPHPPSREPRVEAHRPISDDLLAAVSGQSVTLAERFAEAWFDGVATLIAAGRVIVFDDMVIGEPCPLLLEAVHHVRATRRAEATGEFDEEEERWYEEHEDDELYDRRSIPARVLDAMSAQQEHDRLVTSDIITAAPRRAVGRDRDLLMPMIHLSIAMERLLLELAGAVRIGSGIVDARLLGERLDGLRWAA